ncbi:MAG: BamA/TamA family outer membrane protein [Cyanobacteriota bacterium]|nr:BamA/TamA family outer membrane protein [Cyanobacteriota bacterium]MDY6359293.1 BamA/TamA family outer membrane protein [Cyanobacteriota bacterium]MDY6382803.1 BamA/TamA family outer membrane protein [Cyanobacteriota bacterium]
MHNAAYAIDDVWGSSMDLTGDASQKESQSNTVFDKSNTTVIPVPADTQTAAEQTTKPDTTASSAVPQNQKTIKEIEFYGLNSLPKDEILSQMKMKEGEPYSREDMQNDLKAIYDTGYFSEKMKAIPTDNPDGTVSIKIVVEENIPVKDFTIEGNTVIPTEDILNELEDMKGKPQNIVKINQAIAKIQDLYIQKGYILSRIDSVTDDPDGTINVSIKEGVIDKIMIEGNEKTKDYIIARNILTEPGMVYNENMIKEDLVRLYATQAFKDVTREIEPSETTPDAYDITIKIKEQRTASISVGGGLDTVTGLFGSMGIAENNFRGRAERISLTGLAGTGVIMNDNSVKDHMNIQAELSYFKPYFFNSDTSLNTRLFFRDFGSYQVPMAIERRYGLEFTVAHKLKFNKHATGTFSLGAENIDVKEGDFNRIAILYREYNVPLSERAKQLDGGLFLTLSPALLYDTRDSATVTRHGTMASVRFDESLGLDGFDKTNGRLTGMIKQYIPIAKKSSLAFTVKGGGAIHGDIPEVMAYRLGGPYTIRGFKMSGVGTGNAFVMGSAEFATPIPFMDRTRIAFLNNLRFTVWMDAGKVFDGTVSDTIYDRPMYAVSAGVGLKVFIPGMGPLSIDYGFPLTHSGKNGPDNGYFTFGVGDLLY